MGDPSLWGQLGPKAVGWEEFVTVIVLDDFSHCLQGHGIGAELVGTHVVQGGGLQGIPCRDTGAQPHGHLAHLPIHLPAYPYMHPSTCLFIYSFFTHVLPYYFTHHP